MKKQQFLKSFGRVRSYVDGLSSEIAGVETELGVKRAELKGISKVLEFVDGLNGQQDTDPGKYRSAYFL